MEEIDGGKSNFVVSRETIDCDMAFVDLHFVCICFKMFYMIKDINFATFVAIFPRGVKLCNLVLDLRANRYTKLWLAN